MRSARSAATEDGRTHESDVALGSLLLAQLLERHVGDLRRYVSGYVSDPDETQDLLQDVWLEILRKGYTYRRDGTALAWARAVARNICLM